MESLQYMDLHLPHFPGAKVIANNQFHEIMRKLAKKLNKC